MEVKSIVKIFLVFILERNFCMHYFEVRKKYYQYNSKTMNYAHYVSTNGIKPFLQKKEEEEKISTDVNKNFNTINDTSIIIEPSSFLPEKQTLFGTLERLALMVTTECNMRCRYCYADGGHYGNESYSMTKEDVEAYLKHATTLFHSIQSIQFFGGEPSLNTEAIEATCLWFKRQTEFNPLQKLPNFAMVSNGVNFSDKMHELIKEHKISVIFSIDGPRDVHEINRINVNNKGEFVSTLEAMSTLRECDCSLGVQMTATPQTFSAGFQINNLVEFSKNDLKISNPHIVPVSSSEKEGSLFDWTNCEEQCIESFPDSARKSLYDLVEGHYQATTYSSRVLLSLIRKKPYNRVCNAGDGTLAISADGRLFPCFMFAGNQDLAWGDFLGMTENSLRTVRNNFAPFTLKEHYEVCKSCWAKNICSSCLGDFLNISNDNILKTEKKREIHCSIIKAVAEETMAVLAELQAEPLIWQKFVTNYSLIYSGKRS